MRKLYYVWLVVITLFFAGTYNKRWLYVLLVVEILVGIALYIRACCLWNGLDVGFRKKIRVVEYYEDTIIKVRMERKVKKHIGLAAIRIRLGYRQEKPPRASKMYCGICKGGDMEFMLLAPYCGVVRLELKKVWLNDWLMGFFIGRRRHDTMELFVMPQEAALQIEYPNLLQYGKAPVARLCLDLTGLEEADQELLDRFYILLNALVAGLLKGAEKVRVYWYDEGRGKAFNVEVHNFRECRKMLLELYLAGLPWVKPEEKPEEPREPVSGSYYVLDLQLRWLRHDRLIYQFSRQNLKEEIKEKTFTL